MNIITPLRVVAILFAYCLTSCAFDVETKWGNVKVSDGKTAQK